MDLDTMLADAAPARHEPLDGPDSPAAVSLYQRITTTAPAASRRRRRIVLPVTAAAAALAAAATALALIFVSPAGTHQGGAQHATLAAWTTFRQPDGLVQVTIWQLRDPEGLARALRADGIPANVQFISHHFAGGTGNEEMPPSCHAPRISDRANANLQAGIMPQVTPGKLVPGSVQQGQGSFGFQTKDASGWVVYVQPLASGRVKLTNLKYPGATQAAALYIQSSAIPRGIGLYLAAWAPPGSRNTGSREPPPYELQTGLVVASPQCTGS